MARICARPNCNGVVSTYKAQGVVNLYLETGFEPGKGPAVGLDVDVEICGNCAVDLIDWWNRGKK